MSRPTVLILGNNIGAFGAALAATQFDVNVLIAAQSDEWRPAPGRFLTSPWPLGIDFTNEPVNVATFMEGQPQDYYIKRDGDWNGFIEPDDAMTNRWLWDQEVAYDILISMFGDKVQPFPSMNVFAQLSALIRQVDPKLILNGESGRVFCTAGHGFSERSFYGSRKRMHIGDDINHLSASHDKAWYRSVNYGDKSWTEWSANSPKPPLSDLEMFTIPVDTTCSCTNNAPIPIIPVSIYADHTSTFDETGVYWNVLRTMDRIFCD